MKHIVMVIRSVLFMIVFYSYSLLFGIAFVWAFFVSQKTANIVPTCWAHLNRFTLRWICNIKVEIKGLENLPLQNGYIVAAKHESAMETVLLHMMVPNGIYVLKKILLWVPVAGWYFWKTGSIAIDRKGGTKAMRHMLTQAQRQLGRGFNIMIFPEGTRVKPRTPSKYNPGVALLYDECKVPVVPVALNTGYFWPKNSYHRYPGTATFEFLPPIQPGLEKRAFLKQLSETIEKACQQLNP